MSTEPKPTDKVKAVIETVSNGKVGAGQLSLAGVVVLVLMEAFRAFSGADAVRDARMEKVYEITTATAAQVQVMDNRLKNVEDGLKEVKQEIRQQEHGK